MCFLSCCVGNQTKDMDNLWFPKSDNKMKLWSCLRGCSKVVGDEEESYSRQHCRDSRVAVVDQIEKAIGRESGLEIYEMHEFVITGEELGRGANSEVRVLLDVRSKQKFAGKFLRDDNCSWSLLNEAVIMRQFSCCANIAHVEGIIVNPKILILRYYENGDLATALMRDNDKTSIDSESDFPFFVRLKYIQDTCRALTFLHRSNVCHRDLSMRNLLLSDDKKRVLLTDFTLSREVNGTLETQKTITPDIPIYSPPEAFANNKEKVNHNKLGRFYSLKSDIWGLGITMFEIIEKKTFVQPRKGNYILPTKLPAKNMPPRHVFDKGQFLMCEILRCLYPEPKKRPWSWEVLMEITKMLKNPRGCVRNDEEYVHRFDTFKTSVTSNTNTTFNFQPRFSAREWMIETISEVDFLESVPSEITAPSRREWNGHTKVERSCTTPNFLNTPMPNALQQTKTLPNPPRLCIGKIVPQLKVTTSFSLVSPRNSFNGSEFSSSWTNNQRFDPNNYCKPLNISPSSDSNCTNIAFSKDRHFFDEAAMMIINQADILPPDSEESCSQETNLPAVPERAQIIYDSSSESQSELTPRRNTFSAPSRLSPDKPFEIEEALSGDGNNRSDLTSSEQESVYEVSYENPERWCSVK